MKLMFFVIATLASAMAFAGGQDLSYLSGDMLGSATIAALGVAGSIQVLRDKRAGIVQKMREMLDAATAAVRDFTAEESTEYSKLKTEVESFTAQIERAEDLEALEGDLDAPRGRTARPPHAPGAPAKKEFESFGEFMHAVRFNTNDQRLSWQENPVQGEQRMDDGASGGFMVPKQFRSELLMVEAQDSIVRPRANVIPAGSPPDAEMTMPALDQTGDTPGNVFGGVTVNWIGEGDTKPETSAKLREVTLKPQEVAGHVVVTDKLLRNWQAASPFLQKLLRGAIMQSEDQKFLTGSGAGCPQGVLVSGAAKKVNRTTASTVKYADIVEMESRLLARGGSPVWVGSQSIIPQLAKMTDDDGRLIWVASARDGLPDTLLGRPFLRNERSPLLGTEGDLSLLNLAYYLIKDGSGPFVSASEHVHFLKNKTVIKCFWNVDGQAWLTAPYKQEKGYEVSPFVVLK